MGQAWHPTADIIATCGVRYIIFPLLHITLNVCQMDRVVKIWRIPQVDHEKIKQNQEHLAREDKPLFSTNLLHKSRVLGIAWWVAYLPCFRLIRLHSLRNSIAGLMMIP